MAYQIRRDTDAVLLALVAAWNAKQEAQVASFFHADITQITSGGDYRNPTVTNDSITAANGTDLATSTVLVNQIKKVLNRHFVDPRAHNTTVSPVIATADGTDLASNITLANAIVTARTTHLSAAGVHFTNDGTNTTSSAAATDQATLNTLINELKTDHNAHFISAPLGTMIQLVSA